MTTQTDYCHDEWDLILGAPGLIALAIIQAEPCSLTAGYAKLRAVKATIAETSAQGVGSGLLQAVLDAARDGQSPLWPTEYPRELGDTRAWALASCRRLAALLGQRAPEADADAYGHWLMHLAQRVALAAEDGGRADEGLAGCSARQRAALEALAATLDVPLAVAAAPAP